MMPLELGHSLQSPQPLTFEGNICDLWKTWKQELLLYLDATEASSKSDTVKSSIFLTCIGKKGREIYNTFTFEQEGERMVLSKILEKFDAYCMPRKSLTFLRYNFLTYRQKEGETFDKFVTQLRKLSQDCDLGTLRNSLIKDIVIIGTNDKSLQERLLREPDIDLDKAINHGQAAELTKKQARVLQTDSNLRSAAAIVRKNNYSQSNNKPKKELINQCKFCSYTYERRNCPAYNKLCNKCKKRGHFSSCCPSKNLHELQRDNESAHSTNFEEPQDFFVSTIEMSEGNLNPPQESQPGSYSIDTINNNEWLIDITTNGSEISYKIDSGAQVKCAPKVHIQQAEVQTPPY